MPTNRFAAVSPSNAAEIEAMAKRRLADEYDAAQERGEIRSNGERSFSGAEKVVERLPPLAAIGANFLTGIMPPLPVWKR